MSLRTVCPPRAARRLLALLPCAAVGIACAASGSWSTTGPWGGSVDDLELYEAGPATLWAVGNGAVFRTTSGGASWQRVGVGLPASAYVGRIAAASTLPVVYAASRASVYRSGNGGDLWVPLAALPGALYASDVSVRRGFADSVAVATDAGAFVSTNGGSTWTGPAGPAAQYSRIEFAADGRLYLGVEYDPGGTLGGNVLLASSDGGASWAPLALQPPGLFRVTAFASSPVDAQRLFASDGVTIATSADGGTTWASVATPESGAGCGVSSLAADPATATGLFVGCFGNGLHWTANVAAPAWSDWGLAQGFTINGVDPAEVSAIAVHPAWGATPAVFAGTPSGGLLHTTNGGAAWNPANQGYQASTIRALAAHPVDEGSGAVVLAGYGDSMTTSHAVYRSPDAGTTWLPSHAGLEGDQVRALAIDPGTVDANPFTSEPFTAYAVGLASAPSLPGRTDGGIYKSIDGGASWSTIDSGIALVDGIRSMGVVRSVVLDPRSCAAPPPSGPCAPGSGALQTLYVGGSGRPDTSSPGLPYRSARIYRSTDAGASWTAADNGLPLPQDIGPAGTPRHATSHVVPLVIDPQDPDVLYAGTFVNWDDNAPGSSEPTLPNGVFKSVDGGASWTHASSGLPRLGSITSSQWHVLALAVNPANPQVLYAGAVDLRSMPTGRIYKSTDGAASWTESSTGIAGQDIRALFIDPADPSGDTVYAGTGGDGSNPGGVYRSTDGGATWNSLSLGLPAYSATALAMPARATGTPARLLAGTNAGVWEYTAVPDEDADGAPSSMENSVAGGDGDGDGTPDAQQAGTASLAASAARTPQSPAGGSVGITIALAPGGACTRLNDSNHLAAELFPPDPLGEAGSHAPWGMVGFALPACSLATVRVIFHGATFDARWSWRNHGPRRPGDDASFGWYTFAGARLVDAETWELVIDADRQGNYRPDADDILFFGGPAFLPDVVFGNGFE
jgi:photosystem II stability/assembly factor-like uncharacterized protein